VAASYPLTYFPILVQILIAVAVAGGMLAGSYFLGKRAANRVKGQPYECGVVPTGNARERVSVMFYLVAMVFILFDVEAIFLYPWAVVYRELKLFAFGEMVIFIGLVLCGFFYIWKEGALDWGPESHRDEPS
jgi:NADH-quinone oxidoreductase subunit A